MALGAPFDPPSSVSAPFYGYLKLKLHRSEERVTEDQTGNFQPRRPRTYQLSYACSYIHTAHLPVTFETVPVVCNDVLQTSEIHVEINWYS